MSKATVFDAWRRLCGASKRAEAKSEWLKLHAMPGWASGSCSGDFRDAVGISPKLFSRMQRFQRVFQATEGADSDWVDAAVQNGYFDQAHLIRDFREFAGKAPTSLQAGEVDLARRFLRSDSMSHFSNTRSDGAL